MCICLQNISRHLQEAISHILTTDVTKDGSHHGVYFTAIQFGVLGAVNFLLSVCGNFMLSSPYVINLSHECAVSFTVLMSCL